MQVSQSLGGWYQGSGARGAPSPSYPAAVLAVSSSLHPNVPALIYTMLTSCQVVQNHRTNATIAYQFISRVCYLTQGLNPTLSTMHMLRDVRVLVHLRHLLLPTCCSVYCSVGQYGP